jgi:hypothetical protein
VFLGSWTSTDADASLQTMEIRAGGDGAVEVTVQDRTAPLCSGAASTMTGTGQLDGDGDLVIAAPLLVCDDGTTPAVGSGPPLHEQLANLTFIHDAAADELSDSFGVVWRRDGAGEAIPESPQPRNGTWVVSPLCTSTPIRARRTGAAGATRASSWEAQTAPLGSWSRMRDARDRRAVRPSHLMDRCSPMAGRGAARTRSS